MEIEVSCETMLPICILLCIFLDLCLQTIASGLHVVVLQHALFLFHTVYEFTGCIILVLQRILLELF